MRKSIRIGFPIVCVGVIVITFGMINDIKNKAEMNKEKAQKQEESNFVEMDPNENVLENQISNSVINEIQNGISTEDGDSSNSFFGTETDVNISKAIYILKEQIEIDEQKVYLTSEGEEEGRYIIAARNIETTETEEYYIIDIEKQEVEIYY